MVQRIRPQAPRRRRRTYFKEWRLYRGLSQERLADRLETSVASVSRIEAGIQPYGQDYLEALADVLRTDPASLLMRNPEDPEAIWSIWEQAKEGDRHKIVEIAKTITGKTGT